MSDEIGNMMRGDISLEELYKVKNISTIALKAKAMSDVVSMFQKRDRSSPLAKEGVDAINYKNLKLIKKYVSERGKILSSRISFISGKQQRELAKAIKIARFLGLLAYVDY